MERWQHDFDQMLWNGERTQDDGNQTEYEPQNVKDFIFNHIIDIGEKPSAADVMAELDIPDEFYTDVVCELNIYDHEEEIDFREECQEVITSV